MPRYPRQRRPRLGASDTAVMGAADAAEGNGVLTESPPRGVRDPATTNSLGKRLAFVSGFLAQFLVQAASILAMTQSTSC